MHWLHAENNGVVAVSLEQITVAALAPHFNFIITTKSFYKAIPAGFAINPYGNKLPFSRTENWGKAEIHMLPSCHLK